MRAHEAGALHAEGSSGPSWLRAAAGRQRAGPAAVGRQRRAWRRRGAAGGRRRRPRPGPPVRHPRLRRRRGRLPRPGAGVPAGLRRGLRRPLRRRRRLLRRQGVPLHGGRPLGGAGGAAPRRLLRRRARRRDPGRAARGADRAARQQQVDGRDRGGADARCRPDRRGLVRRRSTASPGAPSRLGVVRTGDGAGDRRGRGAHPRVHRHRPRGPEVRASAWPAARPTRRSGASSAPPTGCRCAGLHSHIGSQIFDVSGFEVAARRVLDLRAAGRPRARRRAARARPRWRLRHRLHHPARPAAAGGPGRRAWPTSWAGVPRRRRRRAAHLDRARAGRSPGPSTFTLYEVGTVKEVAARRQRLPHLRGRRRRHERQHPPGAVRRRLLLHRGQPGQRRAAGARPGGRQALRERRHRRQGRVPAVATSPPATCSPSPAPAPTAAACPASTTTSRARRWSRSATGRRGVIVRRETIEDLLGLDVD